MLLRLAFRKLLPAISAIVGVSGCATGGPSLPPDLGPDVPYAIYDVANRQYIDLNALADAAAPADIVFFGEFHDDAIAHRLEVEVLRRLGERRRDIILGLEMFERDVQPRLEEYLAGELDEEAFLRAARPWTNYRSDYRPLVELAMERGWAVVGTNLPQSLASAIAREGLPALERISPTQRVFAAAENECAVGEYWERFIDAITEDADSSGHIAGSPDDPMLRTMFEAQCARDEAMAESLAGIWSPGTLIFHVNGAFHSDFRLGIVPRLLRRQGELDVRVISSVPVEDISAPDLRDHLDRADYVIFTPEPE